MRSVPSASRSFVPMLCRVLENLSGLHGGICGKGQGAGIEPRVVTGRALTGAIRGVWDRRDGGRPGLQYVCAVPVKEGSMVLSRPVVQSMD